MTAKAGHNNPPDPLETALAPYGDHITEAESWLDGEAVTDEGQMKAVDALAKHIKAAKKDVEEARKSEVAPLNDIVKATNARYKPTAEDLDRITKGLAALVDGFKRKLAAEKAAAEKAAWEAANAARREGEAKARAADAADIEAQREAAAAKQAAVDAEKAAQASKRDTVPGMRKVTETVVLDEVALARYLWQHDRAAQVEFQADRARKLGLDIPDVVERRSERRAF